MSRLQGPGEVHCVQDWLALPLLERVASRMVEHYRLPKQDGADLSQEVRIALWGPGLGTPVSSAWVLQVARNKAVDIARRRFRQEKGERAFARLVTGFERDPELELLLHASVKDLPDRGRELFHLHYEEGFSEREIGARLHLCRASVRWLDYCCRRVITGCDRSSPQSTLAAHRDLILSSERHRSSSATDRVRGRHAH